MGGVDSKPLREPVFIWFYESKDYSVQLGGWREVNDLVGIFLFFKRFSQMLLLLGLSIRPLGRICRKDCPRILVPNGCRRWSVESLQEAWQLEVESRGRGGIARDSGGLLFLIRLSLQPCLENLHSD